MKRREERVEPQLDEVALPRVLGQQLAVPRYDPSSHFWTVSNKPNQAFSSAKPGWVELSDQSVVSYQEGGGIVTEVVDSGEPAPDGELAWILWRAGLPGAVVAACGVTDWGNTPPADRVSIICAIGCRVTSTAHPEWDAAYEICGQPWSDTMNEVLYIQAFGRFSGGETTFQWHARDAVTTFSATSDFKTLVGALGDYLTVWKRYVLGGSQGPLPTVGSVVLP